MRIQDANRIFRARDVYKTWKILVSQAEESVTIYTPFLDRLLLSLLNNLELNHENITVVTDFIPETLLENPKQLLTIKRALSRGINVLSLSRLHAKVLLIDDRLITIGSQNFTSYARKSKECTTVPQDSLSGSDCVNTLIKWRETAIPIDESLVDLLISKLRRLIKDKERLLKETKTVFNIICEQHDKDKQKKLIQHFEALEQQSPIRMSTGFVYASIERVYGDYDDYYTLKANAGQHLTDWVIKNPDGTTEPYSLRSLYIYPIILADKYRMGFARIGKTRITYIRQGVTWTGDKLHVDGLSLDVKIEFQNTNTKKSNIVVTLSHSYFGKCIGYFLFTGDKTALKHRIFTKGESNNPGKHESFKHTLDTQFFGKAEKINDFFAKFFRSFKFKKLKIGNKNVEKYLDGNHYRLSVIQYLDTPFLVARKIR